MNFRASTLFLTAIAIGGIVLPACWDTATLDVTALTPSDGGADATPTDDGSTLACTLPLVRCGASCTNPAVDALNCGSCGNDCTTKLPPPPTCVGSVATASGPGACTLGACQFPTQTMDCGMLRRACTNGICGDCTAGFQDKDLDGNCTPDCATAALDCGANGACSDANGTARCVCLPGFAGPACATNIDECAAKPCLNGGICVDGIASYTCQCVGGFSGINCQTPPAGPLVFVSSGVKKGNIGGLAAADTFCQGLAMAKGLPGTFKALLSDGATSAATRLARPAGSYKLVTGTVIANTANDLFSGTLLAPVDRDEGGAQVVSAELWTGSDDTGTATGSSCNNWTDGTAAVLGTEGVNAFTDGRWLLSYDQFCDRDARVYCVQQ